MTAYANEIDAFLARLDEGFPPVQEMSPAQARAAVTARLQPAVEDESVQTVDREVVRDDGSTLSLRVYRPATRGTAPAPALVFLHGGGFVICSLETHDRFCRDLAHRTGLVVVSVDYRLAPEHRAPAAALDAWAAADWAARSCDALGTDGTVILAGDSAGGNLAAAAALAARARGPEVVGQVLLYPMLDPALASASHERYGSGHFLTDAALRWYWGHYLGEQEVAEPVELVAPPRAGDLGGAPPAVVVTAGRDPLCDEGRDYARALAAAGAAVRHRHYPELFHGFLTIADLPAAEAALALLCADIRRFCPPASHVEEHP
jgi:acetyl esterase